jgi:hypothetical protein
VEGFWLVFWGWGWDLRCCRLVGGKGVDVLGLVRCGLLL